MCAHKKKVKSNKNWDRENGNRKKTTKKKNVDEQTHAMCKQIRISYR